MFVCHLSPPLLDLFVDEIERNQVYKRPEGNISSMSILFITLVRGWMAGKSIETMLRESGNHVFLVCQIRTKKMFSSWRNYILKIWKFWEKKWKIKKFNTIKYFFYCIFFENLYFSNIFENISKTFQKHRKIFFQNQNSPWWKIFFVRIFFKVQEKVLSFPTHPTRSESEQY